MERLIFINKKCLLMVLCLIVSVISACGLEATEESKIHVIEIDGFVYTPAKISVKVGDSIRWINRDAVPHTATAVDQSWDSGRLNQGESWTLLVTSETAGKYYCVYHPTMTDQFLVMKN